MLPEAGLEVATSLDKLCTICVARGHPRIPQAGPEIANSLGDFCVIFMIETIPDPPLGP